MDNYYELFQRFYLYHIVQLRAFFFSIERYRYISSVKIGKEYRTNVCHWHGGIVRELVVLYL